ncbi:Elongator complex protein [Vigna angularis]|uniref:Elongator complex protein 5 n=1 Tax=Phaseolus angularis TaxID=3914 RepID=A0A8T0K386_PHAAN|nr:Elongator complex protein [Vigna angularis]
MADSICRTLRDGALEGELAPTLTIKDSLASPFAFHVFSHILLQLSSHVIAQKSQSQGIVIVALSRAPSSYAALLNMNGVDVASSKKWIHILDCYTDPLGWKDKTRKSANATDCSPQISVATSSFKTVKDVDKLFSVITELGRGLVGENKARFCVAIDSLSELLRHASLQSVAGLLSDLRSHDQISNIFGLLHSDLHEERAVAVLEYMSSMVASVDPYHSADEFKVESGGITFAIHKAFPENKHALRLGLNTLRLDKMKSNMCHIGIDVNFNRRTNLNEIKLSVQKLCLKTSHVQFNLQLSEKERVDRSNVVLPFEHQGNGKPIQIYDGRRSLEESNSEANPISSGKKEDSAMVSCKVEVGDVRRNDDEMQNCDEDGITGLDP